MNELSTKVATHKIVVAMPDKSTKTVFITKDMYNKTYPVWSNPDHRDYKRGVQFGSWSGHFWDIKNFISLADEQRERERGYTKLPTDKQPKTEKEKSEVLRLSNSVKIIEKQIEGIDPTEEDIEELKWYYQTSIESLTATLGTTKEHFGKLPDREIIENYKKKLSLI